MFDKLIRELQQLERGETIAVPIPSDAEGYLDKECPSASCLFGFKIHEEDWRDKVRDEEVFCPFCGHGAPSKSWFTTEQIEQTKKIALAQVKQRIGHAMKQDADDWNRRQPRNSFISITMQVNNRPQQIMVPPSAAEPMRLKITCPACACRYAVIGAAFFCPSCGHNAADLMFNQAVTGIRNVLNALGSVRDAIADLDTAETTARHLTENALQNAVTAFQRYAEALYARFPSAPAARRNAFQNLLEGSNLWHAATGKHYVTYLDVAQQNDLGRFFQQRHLLAHTQGLVDDDYIRRTGDTTYRTGQRLVIREGAVRDCLTIIEKLISGMAADTP